MTYDTCTQIRKLSVNRTVFHFTTFESKNSRQQISQVEYVIAWNISSKVSTRDRVRVYTHPIVDILSISMVYSAQYELTQTLILPSVECFSSRRKSQRLGGERNAISELSRDCIGNSRHLRIRVLHSPFRARFFVISPLIFVPVRGARNVISRRLEVCRKQVRVVIFISGTLFLGNMFGAENCWKFTLRR